MVDAFSSTVTLHLGFRMGRCLSGAAGALGGGGCVLGVTCGSWHQTLRNKDILERFFLWALKEQISAGLQRCAARGLPSITLASL